ncbi:hypothetical protein AMECASPLE_039840 [Ameca splendens]|uniref:Uncharacterized protein n=1 Tax=Ameca splendens TaxID=208324 RepID=A0ABV1A403_9TELE
MQKPICETVDAQNLELFGSDWETFDDVSEEPLGVQVPEIDCPLSPTAMEAVQSMINPLAPSESYGQDLFASMVQYVESHWETSHSS